MTEYEKDQNDDSNDEIHEDDDKSTDQVLIQDYQPTRYRERRRVKASKRLGYVDLIAYAFTAVHKLDQDPEAVESKNSFKWIKSMQEEIESLYKNDT